MLAQITLAAIAGLLTPASTAQTEAPQVYVELIVKACPSRQPDTRRTSPMPCKATTPSRSIRA